MTPDLKANMKATPGDPERLLVTYRLRGDEAAARELAEDICYEQTVEVVPELAQDDWIQANVLGQIQGFARVQEKEYEAVIAYPVEVAAFQLPQLLTLLFGNISLKQHIRISAVEFPPAFMARFQGPRYGISGLRELLKVKDRPLLATALKPMGKSLKDLAKACYDFAVSGIDIIKDDHGLCDQPFCPFQKRVVACLESIDKAAQQTGRRSLYFPSLALPWEQLIPQVTWAQSKGVGGLLISPFILGIDLMRFLSESPDFHLPIMAHPALTGVFFNDPSHGISREVLLGHIFRLAGADMVVYPNFGGRFPFSETDCQKIARALKAPWHELKAAFPVPAGGLSIDSVQSLHQFYGPEVVFLVGSSLYTHSPNLSENGRYFLSLVQGKEERALTNFTS